ncbi:MAG TPA: polysaccharide biosynthesis tyrosine autokinase [Candidatus Acidoferrales bacterium]|nr:polysaccharide biosynthesis tyrosine autokinase [Candidatus Acidoferrales bacterium]
MDSPETHAAPESRLHFLDYWRIIRIRKAIIISVFFITTVIATVVTFLMRPAYSSTAQIEIQPDITSDVPIVTSPYDPYFMETELNTIKGDVVLSRVVDDLNLNADWGKKFSPDGRPLKTSDTMDILRRYISMDSDRNTKLIDITVQNEDRDKAALIANTIAQDYKSYRLEVHSNEMESGIQKLHMKYMQEEAQIQLDQSNVEKLRKEFSVRDMDPNATGPTATINSEQVQQLNEKILEQNALVIQSEKEVAEFEDIQTTNPTELGDVLLTIKTDTTLSDLLSKLHENEQRFVTESNYISAANPDLASTVSLMATLKQEIANRVNGIMFSLEGQVDADKAGLDALNQRLHDLENQGQDELETGQPYWIAKASLQDEKDLHKLLAEKVEANEADAQMPKNALVTVINPATPGEFPVAPKKTLNIALGAFFGLLVGVSLAFFIEYLDTSVKTIDEVERVFQSPVLGVIPQNVGTLIDEGADSSHAEAYRVLRTNILFSRKDENLNTLVVVSAGMGEGKSTTVLNLATIFAQSGQRALVVDSDLRRPTLHKLLRLGNDTGLINYLLKQSTLDEVIQKTNVPNLDFMPSGKLPGRQINILGSEPMRNLISELKQRYDFILFDSPPIMGLSDASVLASEVDMAIQIIQYRRYPQLMNIRAKQMVEKVGGNLVGIVLNNINMAQDESYYYYGGYYYHNNDDSQETAASKTSAGGSDRVGIQQKY